MESGDQEGAHGDGTGASDGRVEPQMNAKAKKKRDTSRTSAEVRTRSKGVLQDRKRIKDNAERSHANNVQHPAAVDKMSNPRTWKSRRRPWCHCKHIR